MKPVSVSIICLLTFAVAPTLHAASVSCTRPKGAVEMAICGNSDLREADAALSDTYGQVRAKTAGSVKAAFVVQQKKWLDKRNRSCSSGAADCLLASYKARQAQLDALLSRAAVLGPDTLPDVTPLELAGRWTVGEYLQLEGEPHHDSTELRRAARESALPSPGQVITGTPGKICFDASCRIAGFGLSTLGQVFAEARWAPALKLPGSTPVYSGAWGNRTDLTLIQNPDGSLLAEFGACGPASSNCATAFQIWRPQDKASRIVDLLTGEI